MSELIAQASSSTVVVRSPQAGALADALVAAGTSISRTATTLPRSLGSAPRTRPCP